MIVFLGLSIANTIQATPLEDKCSKQMLKPR